MQEGSNTRRPNKLRPISVHTPPWKRCVRCGIEKENHQFGLNKKRKDGLTSYCYDCSNRKQEEYRRLKGIPKLTRRQSEADLPETKKCTRCHEIKSRDQFRVKKGRQYKGVRYIELNPRCFKCDAAERKIYYDKKKNDPEFKKKNIERQKEYVKKSTDKIRAIRMSPEYKKKHADWNMTSYYRVRDRISAKMKTKRQTQEYKKMMSEYRNKNKDKIFSQEVITKRRYQEKHKDALTDLYIGSRLASQTGIPRNMIPQPLIELKRVQILIKRELKKQTK